MAYCLIPIEKNQCFVFLSVSLEGFFNAIVYGIDYRKFKVFKVFLPKKTGNDWPDEDWNNNVSQENSIQSNLLKN